MNGYLSRIVLVIFCTGSLSANLSAQIDSSGVLTLASVLQMVRANHPIAAQADLQLRRGQAGLKAARGGFDPRLYTNLDQKNYDGTAYYSQLDGGVRLPTWFGVEFKAGYNQQTGTYLNPENTTPPGGLAVAGIKVPIGQGLLIDQRRAALFKARIDVRAAEAERRWLLNDLLFQAASTYWEWVRSENQLAILNNARSLAASRLDFVRGSFVLGSRAAIDTLEAFVQVQALDQEVQAAQIDSRSARFSLSTFLWSPDGQPLELQDQVMAPGFVGVNQNQTVSADSVQQWMNRIEFDHPDILRYELKLNALDIDRKLKADQLKPKINFQYNLLTEPVGSDLIRDISPSNYKWGLEFEFPLFLRKERGELDMARIRLEETTLDRDRKLVEWQNKAKACLFESENLKTQIELMDQTVINYQRLLMAERNRLENGESSLFLVNNRQMKLIEAELKQNELQAKLRKTNVALLWALGIRWRMID